jgi:hypothetical protein
MNQPTRHIEFNRDTCDYSAFLDGQYLGSAPTEFDADTLINRAIAERLSYHHERQRMIARLAVEYGKAKAEGRTQDALALKAEGTSLIADRDGIEYSVFTAEFATFQAQKQAA